MACTRGDILEVGPALEGGGHLGVRHTADHRIEVARVRAVKDGENVNGHRLLIGETRGNRMFVKEEVDLSGNAASGPPQVATEEYRQGWERIFGSLCDHGEES